MPNFDEWYTPSHVAEAVRETLDGRIDLDPASCEEANQIIRATKIFTKATDGMKHRWEGNVFFNPPYSQLEINQWAFKFRNKYRLWKDAPT